MSLEFTKRNPLRASISRIENGRIINVWEFMFNPNALNRSRRVVWDFMKSPGGIGSVAEFVRTDDQSISFDIFLAARRSGQNLLQRNQSSDSGLRAELAEIESWTLPSLDLFLEDDTQFISPPTLVFSFGKRTWECVATGVSVKETQHDLDLNPTLAVVSVQLQTKHDSFAGIRREMNSLYTDRVGFLNAVDDFGVG